ncbi:hypothetical protein niasHS_016984 [Heterodera schachtii]|uniref:Uncharacterized protein n=1 Tax=Heterodera schachtii TaxID=97005 RepID=A0ABD2I0R1_HETSC
MAAPSIRLITTSKAPPATGHSQAVLLNNQTLYISGQTGIAAGSTNVVPGGARAEAKQAMTNIGEILTYAGSSFKHVINCNIMVADMSDFQAVNETIKNFFTEDTYPARSFFQVVKLPKSAWICNEILMDILPFFRRPQLGLKLALISDRFDVLVDAHFGSKTTQFKFMRRITICKEDKGPKAKLIVHTFTKELEFPLPDRPLPNKFNFICLQIEYIDHSVLAFLRSNQHIFARGTNLYVNIHVATIDSLPFWDVMVRKIWPIFAKTTMRHQLNLCSVSSIANFARITSPTILTDLNINAIDAHRYFPHVIAADDHFDGPNAAATTTGQQILFDGPSTLGWVNNFKEIFLRATTSVSYQINFVVLSTSTQIVPFELVNERTNEKLTLWKSGNCRRIIKRYQIGETAVIHWEENWTSKLNTVTFNLGIIKTSIGQLSPPAEEEKEEEGQSNENVA